jgi:hypothetical protein
MATTKTEPPASGTDLVSAVLRAKRAQAELYAFAAKDPATFCGAVLRDDRTGLPLRLAPMHEAWHDLLSAHDRVVLWSHVSGGKTTQVSIGRVLWELGRDPSLRVLVLSSAHEQAAKIISALAAYIERSEALHKVFPNLWPTEQAGEPWKPLSGRLTVRRPNVSKDATITASGVHGSILGARYDLIIIDDVLDYENTRTASQRKEVLSWLQSTVQTRLTGQGRIWVVGTAWHPDDVLHHYAKTFSADGTQRAFRYPVLDELGEPRWPEVWPIERIERERRETHPAEFARAYLCEARDDSQARFKQDWINVALERGMGRSMARMLRGVPQGYRTFTGIDLAIQKHAAADVTAMVTIIVHPDGSRELLEVKTGQWHGPEIVEQIVDVHSRFGSIVTVENVAAQDYIAQFTRRVSAVPLRTFTTGRGQASLDFQADGLAAELSNGKWIIPNDNGQVTPEVRAWIQEMLYYDPRQHCGDRLAASLFARHSADEGVQKVQWKRLDLMAR